MFPFIINAFNCYRALNFYDIIKKERKKIKRAKVEIQRHLYLAKWRRKTDWKIDT